MFNHEPVKLQPIKATTNRRYIVYMKHQMVTSTHQLQLFYQSVDKKGLMEWRKRVGEDVANHIARTPQQSWY